MGDFYLDPDRYIKLNVYTRHNGLDVFRDFQKTILEYENKICKKLVLYKFNKIFKEMLEAENIPLPFMLKRK